VFKWPDEATVTSAFRFWAERTGREDPKISAIGYFGSYATRTWGVGSDLDAVIIVRESAHPFEKRAIEFDTSSLPVAADVLVYTREEWARLTAGGSGFGGRLKDQTVWVYGQTKSTAGRSGTPL
jgi:hypothetical protein